jgi:methionine biosynthesis protein MetW
MPGQERNRSVIYRWIMERTPRGGRILDIGCGDGELLGHLVEQREAQGTGIELSQEMVIRAVERGLSVHHGDAEEGLYHYSDACFDLVILSLAVQELAHPRRVLRECFRVGRRVIVVFPCFGYWRMRWQLALVGRAPITPSFPHNWHSSPNRHYLTVSDWEEFCKVEGWKVLDEGFVTACDKVRWWPNLRAEVAMYLLEKHEERKPGRGSATIGG